MEGVPDLPAKQQPANLARFRNLGPAEVIESLHRGRNKNTQEAYKRDLETLREFLEVDSVDAACEFLLSGGPGPANAAVLAWRADLISRYAPNTVNRRLTSVRAMIEMARTLGLVTWQLSVKSVQRQNYRDTAGPGTGGFKELLKVCAARGDCLKTRRDNAMLHLLFGLALRRAEVVGMDAQDLDWEKGRLKILGKGRTETEWLTIPTNVSNALKNYIELRGVSNGALFVSLNPTGSGDGRLRARSLYRIVRNLGKRAGLKVWPHALRHSGITAALDVTDGDVRSVQKFSRHKDLNTLILYDDSRRDLAGKVAEMLSGELDREEEEGGGGA